MPLKRTILQATGVAATVASASSLVTAYKASERREAYAMGVLGVFMGAVAVKALFFMGDGLERVTDQRGRLWVKVPPGEAYRDKDGIVFRNLTEKDKKGGESFYLLEHAEGVPAYVWSTASAIGRHSRRPVFIDESYLRQVAGVSPSATFSVDELKKSLDSFDKGVVLAKGKTTADGFDQHAYYFRSYDTAS